LFQNGLHILQRNIYVHASVTEIKALNDERLIINALSTLLNMISGM